MRSRNLPPVFLANSQFEQRGAGIADMQQAGGRRREADDNHVHQRGSNSGNVSARAVRGGVRPAWLSWRPTRRHPLATLTLVLKGRVKSAAAFWNPCIPERIGDRIAPVAAEIAAADLHPRRRLAALIFGNIQQMLHPLDRGGIIAPRHRILEAAFPLHQAFQDAVQNIIGRQGILVGLVGAQFGGGRLGDDAFRDRRGPAAPARRPANSGCANGDSRNTSVL